ISTLWLARYRLLRSHTVEDLARGLELIEWAARRALPSGVMAEQLHPYTGEPLSVSPLTWSHAAYVRVVREYLDRTAQLNRCPEARPPARCTPRSRRRTWQAGSPGTGSMSISATSAPFHATTPRATTGWRWRPC